MKITYGHYQEKMHTVEFETSKDETAYLRVPGGQQEHNGRSTLWSIAILVAVSLAIRVLYTHGQSITFDENYEVLLGQHDLTYICHKGDGFPPLYAITLHYWQSVFGVASTRGYSVLLGVIGCLAIGRLGNDLGGRNVGLWSLGIASILPIHAFYTSEGRAYSLLLLLATLALTAIMRAIRTDSYQDWLSYVVFATLGLYTHYLFAIFVALTLSVAFVQLRTIKPVFSGAAIITLIAPMVYFWAPCDFKFQQDWYYRVHFGIGELAFTYGSYFLGFTVGPSLRELHSLWVRDAIAIVAPWAGLTIAALGGLIYASRNRIPQKKETPVLLAVAGAPCVMGMMCSIAGVGYQVRYSIWSIIPCIVLLAWLINHGWYHKVGKISTIALVLLFSLAIVNRHSNDRYRNADLKSVATYIKANSKAAEFPVIVISGYMAEPLKYYLDSAKWQVDGVPMHAEFEHREREFDQVVGRCFKQTGQSGWLVYTREFHEDADGVLIEKLRGMATLEQVGEYAGVRLYRVQFGS